MTLHVNGEPQEFLDGLTVTALVAQLGMKADRVAVELNLEIVPRSSWEATTLKDGDKLEIVHFVGGGSGLEIAPQPSEGEQAQPSEESWLCPSCGAACDLKFCASCGEKRPSEHDLSLGHLISHASETFFHWDSRILRTFRVLFTKPGMLSAEYVAGKRKPYAHPFQVFFIANLIYFLVYPILGWTGLKTPLYIYRTIMPYSGWATRMAAHRAAVQGLSMAEFARRFDHFADLQSRSLILLMVPLFALVLLGLEWRKKRYFGEHLVFALHWSALWLVAVPIVIYGGATAVLMILRRWGITFRGGDAMDLTIFVFSCAVLAPYASKALQSFYGDSRLAGLAKSVVFTASVYLVLQVFRFALFLTALYSA